MEVSGCNVIQKNHTRYVFSTLAESKRYARRSGKKVQPVFIYLFNFFMFALSLSSMQTRISRSLKQVTLAAKRNLIKEDIS